MRLRSASRKAEPFGQFVQPASRMSGPGVMSSEQMYKSLFVHVIPGLIALISQFILLQPSDNQHVSFDLKEIYSEFNSDLIVMCILQLLGDCPPELVSIRRDLPAIALRNILDE